MDSIAKIDSLENPVSSIDTVGVLADTLFVKPQGITQVQSVIDGSFNAAFWISIITTTIALITLSILVWDRLKKPKLSGKIISLTFAPDGNLTTTDIEGNSVSFSGIKYFFKISLNVIHKNIFYSNVKVHIKYPNESNKYDGRFYFSNNDNWTFNGIPKSLTIPQDKFIVFNNVLEKDKTLFLYASFFVERQFDHFSEIEFSFITPKGKNFKVGPLKSSDFSTEVALFEDEIWEEIP